MKNHAIFPVVAVALSALTLTTQIHAQSPLVTIDTVTVGDPGNAADITGFGAVDSIYSISKYETTISQYATFLNSVASVTTNAYIITADSTNNYLNELYYFKMSVTNDVRVGGINRSGSGTSADPFVYQVTGGGNRPIANVSWIDAARFANWMNNGATNGASTETGAYTLNGALTGDFHVNPGAIWSLPSEDQWYKAAYYKGGNTSAGYWLYPTQSNEVPGNQVGSAPNQANFCYGGVFSVTQSTAYPTSSAIADVGAYSNSSSAYGTYDQGGSLNEWTDGVILGGGRIIRGGDWNNSYLGMESPTRGDGGNAAVTYQDDDLGFRLVTSTVPEPSTYALFGIGAIGLLMVMRRRKTA
jgi:formylglycine-generating enzyme required for sulfatase activity